MVVSALATRLSGQAIWHDMADMRAWLRMICWVPETATKWASTNRHCQCTVLCSMPAVLAR
jgi:hypothetical protein